jgi:hypothetical protein
MMNNLIRTWLYMVSGLVFSLLGWNLGQFFLTDLSVLKQFPEIVLFPCISISLSIGMMLTEVLLSNPTRFKLSMRTATGSLKWAVGLGLFAGIISGIICQILFLPALHTSTIIVRIFGWLLIGGFVGLAEGFTWRKRSVEAGNKARAEDRLKASILGGIGGSLMAAVLFELLRKSLGAQLPGLQEYEDPAGFGILGICLGFVFSFSSSPSYMVALRAGGGFEYMGNDHTGFGEDDEDVSTSPSVNHNPSDGVRLYFINDEELEFIEEGLSIQLPPSGKIHIGSAPISHIRIPDLEVHVADLEFKGRDTTLKPNSKPSIYTMIHLNGQPLYSRNSVTLKHNNVITFHSAKPNANNLKKPYRFVYYNRFLDPQA